MIRPITLNDDLTRIAELVYATDGFLFPYMFGRGEAATDLLKDLIKRDQNSFSWRYITGYFDEEDVCQGIYIAYHQGNKSNDKDFSKVFKGLNGLWLALKSLPFNTLLNPPIQKTLYLQNLSVHESARSKGIGRALLSDFYESAIREGIDTVSLDVSLDNEGAMRLYLKEGFKLIKKRKVLGLFPMLYYCEKKVQY